MTDTLTDEESRAALAAHIQACERATELGLIEALLTAAHDDTEWRRAVEAALRTKGPLGRLLVGGAKPSDVWAHNSLIHTRVAQSLQSDTAAFVQFGKANPRVVALHSADLGEPAVVLDGLQPLDAVVAACVLFPARADLQADAITVACDALQSALQATGVMVSTTAVAVVDSDETSPAEPDESTQDQLFELKALAHERGKDIRKLRQLLDARTKEVARKDRKNQELRLELADLKTHFEAAKTETRTLRAERDELKRQSDRLRGQAESSKEGIRTVEGKLADESRRLLETITDLRERLSAARDFGTALEKRLATVERELDEEQQRRTELEETFAAFGFDDMAASTRSLQSAVEALVRFRDGVEAYAARQDERERERVALQASAELERQAAMDARHAQEQAALAWDMRERERLAERERLLFPDGQIDHIIIDGHNLLHRVFRPEDEKSTRPWLERVIGLMAVRLEERGWASCIHLVFDTPHNSNSRGAGHGFTIHFQNNILEGGADARIAELLREGNPQSRYMVVSTDRKHVWSDALELMKSDGIEVDLVQIELLAQYLQTLDEVEGG